MGAMKMSIKLEREAQTQRGRNTHAYKTRARSSNIGSSRSPVTPDTPITVDLPNRKLLEHKQKVLLARDVVHFVLLPDTS